MKIHFIGCQGVSMRALARIAKNYGHDITGSDTTLSGHDAKNVHGAGLVVYTCAVGEDNVELIEARRLGIKTLERAEFLGQISKNYHNVIAVSGSHGKTTVTGMLQEVFLPLNPTVHIGGSVLGHEDSSLGNRQYFITEACEYKRNFLHLSPQVTVVLNVELDHPDYYKSQKDYESAFSALIAKSQKAVVNGDDPALKELIKTVKTPCATFGFEPDNNFQATNILELSHGITFDVLKNSRPYLQNVIINIFGMHSVLNALASIAASDLFGIKQQIVLSGLNNFKGVKRRFEYITTLNDAKIFCDYAHHPSELKTTLQTAQKMGFKKITIVFEPHTYTRTKSLKDEFVRSLSQADRIVLVPIFPAREPPIEGVTSMSLARELQKIGKKAIALNTFFEACDYIYQSAETNEVIIFTGAGDINKAATFMSTLQKTHT